MTSAKAIELGRSGRNSFIEGSLLLSRCRDQRNGKPISSNTRIYWGTYNGAACICLELHNTVVVGYLPNGDMVLNAGGWKTQTTSKKINNFAPVTVGSTYKQPVMQPNGTIEVDPTLPWGLGHHVGLTEPKMRRCRLCKGEGRVKHVQTTEFYKHENTELCPVNVLPTRRWFVDGVEKDSFDPTWYLRPELEVSSTFFGPCRTWSHQRTLVVPIVTYTECHRCYGQGEADYGSKRIFRVFQSGMVIDRHGELVSYPAYDVRLMDWAQRPEVPHITGTVPDDLESLLADVESRWA